MSYRQVFSNVSHLAYNPCPPFRLYSMAVLYLPQGQLQNRGSQVEWNPESTQSLKVQVKLCSSLILPHFSGQRRRGTVCPDF